MKHYVSERIANIYKKQRQRQRQTRVELAPNHVESGYQTGESY